MNNLEFVLGNKVMVGTVNANREYFRKRCARSFASGTRISRLAEAPVNPSGEANYQEVFDKLLNAKGAIKILCEVAEL